MLGAARGQICPEGMNYFNDGEFRKAAEALVEYSSSHAVQSGICLYYAGEAYYNLGVEEQSADDFREAIATLRSALLQPDIQNDHAPLIPTIEYKIAWAAFRLYELGEDMEANLETAIARFNTAAAGSGPAQSCNALYLKGESQYRLAALKQDAMYRSGDAGRTTFRNQAINIFNEAAASFRACCGAGDDNLKHFCLLRIQNIETQKARMLMLDGQYETARSLLSGINFDAVRALPASRETVFAHNLILAEVQNDLLIAYLTEEAGERSSRLQHMNELLSTLESTVPAFSSEAHFFQGVRDKLLLPQYVNSNDVRFLRAHTGDNGHFRSALNGIPESGYWLGVDHLISHYPKDEFTHDAYELFRSFAATRGSGPVPGYLENLYDEATYSILKYRYETTAARSAFMDLRASLEQYRPITARLEQKKELLLFLVNMRLSPDRRAIWNSISQEQDVVTKCQQCFALIEEIFKFAVQTVGRDRAGYLNAIDALFEFTGATLPEKTRFYKGMKLFLEGEIQGSRDEKKAKFLEAVRQLENLGGVYEREGRYILARSYFEAAKNEISANLKNQYYRNAESAFTALVENNGSLRSLYYLSEIRFVEGDEYAVKAYCEKITEYLKDMHDTDPVADFLYANAMVRLRGLDAETELRAAPLVDMSKIQYPNILLSDEQGNQISLERFVGSTFTQDEIYHESKNIFLQYSYLKKGPYCSINRPAQSQSDLFAYTDLFVENDECVREISVTFRMKIALPRGITAPSDVSFNDQPVTPDAEGYYIAPGRRINEEVLVKIRNSQCYFYQNSFVLDSPGVIERVISLNKKYMPNAQSEIVDNYSPDKVFMFTPRLDRNILLHNEGRFTNLKSEKFAVLDVTTKFVNDLLFRDFVFSRARGAYLGVHHTVCDRILVFDEEGNRSHTVSDIKIAYSNPKDTLDCPEGITVSSTGDIYIVDYSNHRVLKWNSFRDQPATYLGSLGINRAQSSGQMVKFEYPKRIALVENVNTQAADSENSQMQTLLFVSDRHGIHQFDSNGFYHGSIYPNNVEPDDIAALSAEFVVNKINIYFVNRKTGDIHRIILSSN